MNKISMICLLATLVLSACSQDAKAPSSGPATRPDSSLATPASKQTGPQIHRSRTAGAEEIAKVEASGRTGLWADQQSICAKEPKQRTKLSWNVADSGAKKIVLYVVDKSGHERNFGQAGPVGSRQTGPWLKPGVGFKIREAGTKKELGSIVITNKSC